MKRAVFFLLILGLAGSLPTGAEEEDNPFFDTDVFRNEVKKRVFFNKRYARPADLIERFEAEGAALTIENPSNGTLKVENPPLFYTRDRIHRTIGMDPADSEAEKARKVFEFVDTRSRHSAPLFQASHLLHEPAYFFSVFASGFCDDASFNLAHLARDHGLKTRIWWLDGHVVPEVFHDGSWHVYDADTLGLVPGENGPASMEELVRFAQENGLSSFNEVIRTTENNRAADALPEEHEGNPHLEFLPGEKKHFFTEGFMLTTDGRYLAGELSDPGAFRAAYEHMANFVREIPLSAQTVPEGRLVLDDYFPFAGVFIVLEGEAIPPEEELPQILLDADLAAAVEWIPPVPFEGAPAGRLYLDLTPGIRNLTRFPAQRIKLRRLGPLRDRGGVRLVTVHYYAYSNADFSPSALSYIKEEGLSVSSAS